MKRTTNSVFRLLLAGLLLAGWTGCNTSATSTASNNPNAESTGDHDEDINLEKKADDLV